MHSTQLNTRTHSPNPIESMLILTASEFVRVAIFHFLFHFLLLCLQAKPQNSATTEPRVTNSLTNFHSDHVLLVTPKRREEKMKSGRSKLDIRLRTLLDPPLKSAFYCSSQVFSKSFQSVSSIHRSSA